MIRDPIETLNSRITDLNFQILLLTRRLEELESGTATVRPRGRGIQTREVIPEARFEEVTCRSLRVVDEDGRERVVIEVDDEDNATIEFMDGDGTRRLLEGAFADGEAYTGWHDASGEAVISARCDAEGAAAFETPEAN